MFQKTLSELWMFQWLQITNLEFALGGFQIAKMVELRITTVFTEPHEIFSPLRKVSYSMLNQTLS